VREREKKFLIAIQKAIKTFLSFLFAKGRKQQERMEWKQLAGALRTKNETSLLGF